MLRFAFSIIFLYVIYVVLFTDDKNKKPEEVINQIDTNAMNMLSSRFSDPGIIDTEIDNDRLILRMKNPPPKNNYSFIKAICTVAKNDFSLRNFKISIYSKGTSLTDTFSTHNFTCR